MTVDFVRGAACLLLLLVPAVARAQMQSTVDKTVHNLSITGPGTIRAQTETQICIFCHVPHHGLALGVNRPMSNANYTPYNSTTMVSTQPGTPNGSSRICLSCHDGTIALGQTVASGNFAMLNAGPGGLMPTGSSNLGTDLRGTHPVSFVPSITPDLRAPPPGDPVAYDKAGRVQCTSCHDPHRNDQDLVQGNFLVKSNRASAICTTCHTEPYWLTNPSTHETSTAIFNASQGAITGYTTVADNACESCHTSHGAGSTQRLLQVTGAPLCNKCHNGTVAQTNISADLAKPYTHPILTSNYAVHDESEGPTNPSYRLPETASTAPRHVFCEDCHNPHATLKQTSTAPRADGFISGTWGIDSTGLRVQPINNQYELCFKCHADSANQPQALGPTLPETIRRTVTDVNLRRVFDLSAPSFHPVEGPGLNHDVPSLIAPWTTASMVYCTDCHGSDTGPGVGGTDAAGPHGSIYPHILDSNLSTTDYTPESTLAYALCYNCHSRSVLMDPTKSSFRTHATHVQANSIPCSACHDWHGVSNIQGNPVNNAHLINFDRSIVSPNTQGALQYTTGGYRSGTCSMSCHNVNHVNQGY